jgi:NADPH:quinone reductase-like Zn-dependent oxidoreductase
LALWVSDAINLPATPENPSRPPIPVLVYGGSSTSGTIAIQLLRLPGLNPITTYSPCNFDLVRSFGATAVFDYTDSNTAATIIPYIGGRLKHALNCILDKQSVEYCYAAMARVGGSYTSLELVPGGLLAARRAVHASFVIAFKVTGEELKLPRGYGKLADAGKRDLRIRLFGMFQRLLGEGILKAHPTKALEGGLGGVLAGLELLKSGSVSGKKLVVRL